MKSYAANLKPTKIPFLQEFDLILELHKRSTLEEEVSFPWNFDFRHFRN